MKLRVWAALFAITALTMALMLLALSFVFWDQSCLPGMLC